MSEELYSFTGSVPDRPPPAVTPPKVQPIRAAASSSGLALVPEVVPASTPSPAPASPAGARSLITTPAGAAVPAVVKESVPVASDTDSLTAQTVAKMCEYIRAGMADDWVKWWAECAIARYALGNRAPEAAPWAVYWLVKHAVQFARDEPRLFQVGEPDALDMLIAPAVLVRMAAPKEDCDGFTMLICALLGVLGVKTLIVTVAADPSDPDRWSHVFPVALMGGRTLPLDASHGHAPGWMVPREHIFRWQAWDLDGSRVELPMPSKRAAGLHGYARPGSRMRRNAGMGQGCFDELGDPIDCPVSTPAPTPAPVMTGTLPCYDTFGNVITCGSSAPGTVVPTAPSSPSTPVTVTAPPSTPSIPINWGNIISSAIAGASKVAQTAFLPAGSYYVTGPNGQQTLVTGGAGVNPLSALSASSFGSLLPILGIGLVAILVLTSMSKER